MSTPTLWVYKCNINEDACGDWKEFFEGDRKGTGEWGGTWCIKNPYSRQILREEMEKGDLVLAWQTDQQQAVGLCRVVALLDGPDDGQDIDTAIYLETVMRFPIPIKLLAFKKQYPELINGNAFKQGKLGTLFDTKPDEARVILQLCGVPKDLA
jgi:hypothetical protein